MVFYVCQRCGRLSDPLWFQALGSGVGTRFEDPARFAFAHGGKDWHPFPVRLKVYDESIGVLRRALEGAKVGQSEKLQGMKRLDALLRVVERQRDPHAAVDATVAHERSISPSLGGRTVLDDAAERRPRVRRQQLQLFRE